MEHLLLILLGLGSITLVGHGTWVLAARLIRVLTGRGWSRRGERVGPEECAGCGHGLPAGVRYCPGCGLDRKSARAAELADLLALDRHLRRFLEGGVLPPAVTERVCEEVAARHRHLAGNGNPALPGPSLLPAESVPREEETEPVLATGDDPSASLPPSCPPQPFSARGETGSGQLAAPVPPRRGGKVRRMVGRAAGLLGILGLLALPAAAWPNPAAVAAVALLDGVGLALIAFRVGRPVLHALALPCLAVGYLALCLLFRDGMAPCEIDVFLSSGLGAPLAGLFLLLAGTAEVLAHWRRRTDATYYAGGSILVALASLALVTPHPRGLEAPARAALLSALYGSGILVLNVRSRRPLATCLGLTLLLTASLWALHWQYPGQFAVWGAALAAEALGMVVLGSVVGRQAGQGPSPGLASGGAYREPLARSGEGIAVLALLAAAWAGISSGAWTIEHAITAACLYTLCLLRPRVGRVVFTGLILGEMVLAWLGALPAILGELDRLGATPLPSWPVLAALHGPVAWVLLGGLALGLLVTLWDRRPAHAAVLGLLTALLTLPVLAAGAFEGRHTVTLALCWGLGACFLAGSVLVWSRATLSRLARALRWSVPEAPFLPSEARGLLVTGAVIPVLLLTLATCKMAGPEGALFPWTSPVIARAMPLLLIGLGLAGHALRERSEGYRLGTLALGVAAAVDTSWGLLSPSTPALPLHGSVLLMGVLLLAALLYGVAFPLLLRGQAERRSWGECGRRLGPVLGFLGTLVLLAVLVQEGLLYDPLAGHTPLLEPAAVAVGMALLGLAAAAVILALRRGSPAYVYAGELLLLLLLVHLRLNVPDLFGDFGSRCWMPMVMGLAFLSVAVSWFLGRHGLGVVAGPLCKTGLFLTTLPLCAFWVQLPATFQQLMGEWFPDAPVSLPLDAWPVTYAGYAVLWLMAGLVHAAAAGARRSFGLGLLALLAANAALWAFLHHRGLEFQAHPQAWLIPPALAGLAVVYLRRSRLPPYWNRLLCCLALTVIYASSTADMLIAGPDGSWGLPLVLALLCVGGVLAGAWLRARAFVGLSMGFLLLVGVTLLGRAGPGFERRLILWASGVALGAGLLLLLGTFRKPRNSFLINDQSLARRCAG